MLHLVITISALVTFSIAQGLSAACIGAIVGITTDPAAVACLNPGPLTTLFLNPGNTSIVGPINSWLTGLCAAAPCSNDTLSAIVKNITTGCQLELSVLGPNRPSDDQLVTVVQKAYPIVREVVCLKDNNDNGTNCITQTLKNIESFVGVPLTINKVVEIVGTKGPFPPNVTCTNCVKQAFNIVNQKAPGMTGGATDALELQCGDSFVDGQTPPGITDSASTQPKPDPGNSGSANSNSENDAQSLSHPRALVGASALVVISAAIGVLA